MTRRSSPIRASKSVEEGIDGVRVGRGRCRRPRRGPCRGRSPTRCARHAARVDRRRRWPPSSSTFVPRPRSRCRSSSRARASAGVGPVVDLGRALDAATPSATPLDARSSTPTSAVRPDVDVDEAGAERRGAAQLAGEEARSMRSKNVGSGPGQVARGRRRGSRPARCRSAPSRSRKAGSSAGGSARRRQAVGLSVQICIAVGADLVRALDGLDHPGRQRQVGAEPSDRAGRRARRHVIGQHRGASYDARPWTRSWRPTRRSPPRRIRVVHPRRPADARSRPARSDASSSTATCATGLHRGPRLPGGARSTSASRCSTRTSRRSGAGWSMPGS